MIAGRFDVSGGHQSPVTAPGAVTTDEECESCGAPRRSACRRFVKVDGCYLYKTAASSRYPEPSRAELVTLWHKNKQTVLAITADGKTQDFYMPPGRLVTLLREIAERLADNTILQ